MNVCGVIEMNVNVKMKSLACMKNEAETENEE